MSSAVTVMSVRSLATRCCSAAAATAARNRVHGGGAGAVVARAFCTVRSGGDEAAGKNTGSWDARSPLLLPQAVELLAIDQVGTPSMCLPCSGAPVVVSVDWTFVVRLVWDLTPLF